MELFVITVVPALGDQEGVTILLLPAIFHSCIKLGTPLNTVLRAERVRKNGDHRAMSMEGFLKIRFILIGLQEILKREVIILTFI